MIISFKISIVLSKWKYNNCSCKIFRISKPFAFGFSTFKIKMESPSQFCPLIWNKYLAMQPYVMKDYWKHICLGPKTWTTFGELSPRIKFYLKFFSCQWLAWLNFKVLSLFLHVYARWINKNKVLKIIHNILRCYVKKQK